MTTREFINNNFGYKPSKTTTVSSVMQDTDGNFYSYGYHYPLLFTVNGKTVRNVTGYSNTTARHILWTRDIDAIDIHAGRQFRLSHNDNINMAELIKGQKQYIQSIENRIKHHRERGRREDTRVFADMLAELTRAQSELVDLVS